MITTQIEKIELGGEPRVVCTVASQELFERIVRHPEGLPCDIVEIRLDLLRPCDGWQEKCAALREGGMPVILTVRSADEGGRWRGGEEERLAIYREACGLVPAVDVELRSEILPRVISAADGNGVCVIASYHDFERTPSLEKLRGIVHRAREKGASIAKIATMVNGDDDVGTLTSLTIEAAREAPVCVIGMGPLGEESRLSLPFAGSALAYGYIDRPAAPGQLPCEEVVRYLRQKSSSKIWSEIRICSRS